MPKISIIVPVYNAEKYLHRCINSILEQSFKDFELLLINDGSKDNSGTICEQYVEKDSRVRIFHIENIGANNARFRGVCESKGKYAMFIDSDDTISSNYIQYFYDIINGTDVEIAVHHSCCDDCLVSQEQYIVDMLNVRTPLTMYEKIYSLSLLLESYKRLPRNVIMGEDLMQSVIIALKSSKIRYFKSDRVKYNVNVDNLSSVCHTFKRKYEYEVEYYSLFDKLLQSKDKNVIEAYKQSKNNGLSEVLLSGNKLDYSDSYYNKCRKEYKTLNGIYPESWIVFNVRNNIIARYLIAIKRYIAVKYHSII